jgi:sulfatase modifying factor 1
LSPEPQTNDPAHIPDAAALAGGQFLVGTDATDGNADDEEGPVHAVILSPFASDPHAVTNEQFAEFVTASGHATDAERYGASFVFGGLLPDDFPTTRGVARAAWWRVVDGADWLHPEGPQSDVAARHTIPGGQSSSPAASTV